MQSLLPIRTEGSTSIINLALERPTLNKSAKSLT